MSGGSYEYAYAKIERFVEEMEGGSELREKFRNHLILVTKAMRAIEWVDSGDCSPGDEDKEIVKCLRRRSVRAKEGGRR